MGVRFDELTLTPNYKSSSIGIVAYDLEQRREVKQSVSFLNMVLAIFPDGLGWATIGFPREGFDIDCGSYADYEDVTMSPFEFIAEIIEARETKYKMPVAMKDYYWREMQKVAVNLLSKAAVATG